MYVFLHSLFCLATVCLLTVRREEIALDTISERAI